MIYKSNSCLITWDLDFLWCCQMCHQKKSSGSETCDKSSQSRLIPWRQLIGLHGLVSRAPPSFFFILWFQQVENKESVNTAFLGVASRYLQSWCDFHVFLMCGKGVSVQWKGKRSKFKKSQTNIFFIQTVTQNTGANFNKCSRGAHGIALFPFEWKIPTEFIFTYSGPPPEEFISLIKSSVHSALWHGHWWKCLFLPWNCPCLKESTVLSPTSLWMLPFTRDSLTDFVEWKKGCKNGWLWAFIPEHRAHKGINEKIHM